MGGPLRWRVTGSSRNLASPGMTNSRLRSSPFEEIHFVGEDGLAVAEESDDDAETDGGFGGSVGDDKEGEDLSGDIAKNPGEGDQVDVHGVQDEFDGH